MPKPTYQSALIVGAGRGLSASLARLLAGKGLRVALAARDAEKLAPLCAETGAKAFACDAVEPDQVARLFAAVESATGTPDVVVYNASARARGPVAELVPAEVERAIMVSAFGGFLVAREAARRMVPKAHGAILFTGASASVKGYPLRTLRDGQVCAARPGSEHGSGTGPARHPHCSFRHRRVDPQSRSRRAGGSAGQHARPRRDRRFLCRCALSAALGLGVGGRAAALG
jgi:NAD(P)-dependent dehydrogenase (short-subunit alcohol dehydrogenase family)